jgi:hypothetical protein
VYSSLTGFIDALMTDPSAPSNRIVILPTLQASPILRTGTNTVTEYDPNTNPPSFQQVSVNGNGGGAQCNNAIKQTLATEQGKYGASRVIAGPDLWTITSDPSFHWNNDSLHPYSDSQGVGVMRAAWAQWMEQNVYGSLVK